MSHYTGPKAKLCRREGMNLFERPKYAKIMEKKPGKPGPHGESRGKASGYAHELREKQKLRIMFGLNDNQLNRAVQAAVKTKGNSPAFLMRGLEMRLDNVIYRSGLALTRMQSRQMASHGHFLINGRRTDVPSFSLSVGDKIELRPKLKQSKLYPLVAEENKGYKPSRWLKVNGKEGQVEVIGEPTAEDFERTVDVQKIIEYYSR